MGRAFSPPCFRERRAVSPFERFAGVGARFCRAGGFKSDSSKASKASMRPISVLTEGLPSWQRADSLTEPWRAVRHSCQATRAMELCSPASASKAASCSGETPSGKAPSPTSPQRITAALQVETLPTV